MKNLLGISLAAVLAVSPLMAGAADVDTTAAASVTGDSTTLSTVSYVKGAYSALATGVNSKQDKIDDLATIRSGAAAGATALQSADIATSLTAESDNTKAAGAKATYDAIQAAKNDNTTLAGRVSTAEGKITTLEGTVGDASSGLVKGVTDNAAAITVLNGNDTQAGSVAKTVKDAVDAATTTLNTAIGAKANSADVYTKTAADDKFATQTGVVATINTATVPVMTAWDDSSSATTIAVNVPAAGYVAE